MHPAQQRVPQHEDSQKSLSTMLLQITQVMEIRNFCFHEHDSSLLSCFSFEFFVSAAGLLSSVAGCA
jgi:hypothetical protein